MLNKIAPGRHLAWEACYNVRELGGYPTEDGGETRWGAFLRADTLCRLTPDGEAALVAYGVRTIIDLRNPWELALAPHPFAERDGHVDPPVYVTLPLDNAEDKEAYEAMDSAPTMGAIYVIMLDRFRRRIAAIIQAIGDAGDGAVLFHCFGGKDRTGLVAALLLALAGVAPDTIAEDYALTDVYLQPFYNEELSKVSGDAAQRDRLALLTFTSPPEAIHIILSYLSTQYGGVEAFLIASGVTPEAIASIRGRIRA